MNDQKRHQINVRIKILRQNALQLKKTEDHGGKDGGKREKTYHTDENILKHDHWGNSHRMQGKL